MNKNDPTTVDLQAIIESAERLGVELDAEAARSWLEAMQKYSDDHEVASDVEAGIYGHRVALLDFSPAELTRFREIGEIIGFDDVPGQVETALVLSGSAVQNKVQSYPGDCDYFERVNIRADSREEACAILSRLIRDKALSRRTGDTYELIEVKYGSYPYAVERDGHAQPAGAPVSWSPSDVEQGYVIVTNSAGRPKILHWDDVANDPGWCKLDWIVIDNERGRLACASNMLDVTWEAPDGSITPLDGYLDGYYQEVYLEAESLPIFTKLMKHASPDLLDEYVAEMEKQVKKYAIESPNYGKAAKRLYNVFRLTGRYEEAVYLRELFDEPAALLYQVNALIRTVHEASKPGSSISIDDLIGQTDELIMTVIRVLEGMAEVEIVRYLLRLEHSLLRQEYGASLQHEVEAASAEVLQIVNNFFYERMHAVPAIKAYLESLQRT